MKQWQSCSCQAAILATVQLNLSIRVEWKYRWWTFNFEVDQHNIWGIYSAEMREKGRVNMVQVARIARLPDLSTNNLAYRSKSTLYWLTTLSRQEPNLAMQGFSRSTWKCQLKLYSLFEINTHWTYQRTRTFFKKILIDCFKMLKLLETFRKLRIQDCIAPLHVWRSWLPGNESERFGAYVYCMFAINLDLLSLYVNCMPLEGPKLVNKICLCK
jgi:hypothetical protein